VLSLLLLACTAATGDDTATDSPTPATETGDSSPTTDSTDTTDTTDTVETEVSACAPLTGAGDGDPLLPTLPANTNVLVLSIDTLRKDRIGRYSGLDTTPWLDGWLEQALVLDQHRSCSDWTASSMLCALTGTSPTEAGYEPHAGIDTVLIDVPEDLEGLTSWLGEAGRVVAVITANAVVAEAQPTSVDERAVMLLDRAPAADVIDNGLAVLDSLQDTGSPWFLHLHFNDPHSPYDPPAEYLGGLEGLAESPVDLTDEAAIVALSSDPSQLSEQDQELVVQHTEVRYQGELRYLDDQLARLWSDLEDRGVPDDTLVLVMSDHGEQFFEHGEFTHGKTLYAQEVDALAAVQAPGLAAGIWTGPTAHQDLTPSILHALAIDLPAGATGPLLGSASAERARHGFRQYRDVPPLQVLTRGQHRLFYSWDGTRAFHDLAADPDELADIYSADDPAVQCLWEHLDPWIAQASTFMTDYAPVDPQP
jgi:arylsulfatase